jgi:hypothetical protein
MKYPTTIVLNKKGQAKICIGSATTPKSQSGALSLTSIQEWQYAAPLLLYSVHTLPQLMYANLQISSKKSSTVSWQFFIYKILRPVPVVSCLYLILDHTTLAFSLLFDHQRSISDLHQPTTFSPQPHSINHASLLSQSTPPLQA